MKATRYPTGMVEWGPLADAPSMSIIWPGPGSRLYLGVNVRDSAGTMIPIDHPVARDAYYTEKDAKVAADAFIAL